MTNSDQNTILDVGAALCISLKDRGDRRERLLSEFRKSGLEIEFLIVEKDNSDPQRGCFNSHQTCAKIVIERGYQNALILEDDATLIDWPCHTVWRINNFMKAKNPDIFLLGAILGKMWLTWHPQVARVRAVGAHAYILSKQGANKQLQHDYTGQGIDTLQKKIFKQYCIFPMLSYQQPHSVSPSDIQKHREKISTCSAVDWNLMRKRQYYSIFKNVHRTILRIDI